jgi:glycosyltransferase involved in cell wall biosynthesis
MRHVLLTSRLDPEHGGLTASLLRKAGVLERRRGLRPIIASFHDAAAFPEVAAEIRRRYDLGPAIQITNLNWHYRGLPPPPDAPFDPHAAVEALSEDLPSFEVRWTRDPTGAPYAATITQEGQAIRRVWFRADGSPFEFRRVEGATDFGLEPEVVLDPLSAVAREFKTMDGFRRHFMNELCVPPVTHLVCEARLLDRALLSLENRHARKIFVFHSVHIRPGTDIVRVGNRQVLGHMGGVDALVVLTPEQKADVAARFGLGERIHVIPHAVNRTQAPPPPTPHAAPPPPAGGPGGAPARDDGQSAGPMAEASAGSATRAHGDRQLGGVGPGAAAGSAARAPGERRTGDPAAGAAAGFAARTWDERRPAGPEAPPSPRPGVDQARAPGGRRTGDPAAGAAAGFAARTREERRPAGPVPEAPPSSRPGADQTRVAGRVVVVSRLSAEKNVADAIRAFRVVAEVRPDARLDIWGSGPEELDLRRLVEELGLQGAVRFEGYTNNAHEVFAAAECSLLTSRWEGFGMTVMESMAAGTPCIAYDLKYGPAAMISDGVDGHLVSPGDWEALAQRIIACLNAPEAAKQAMRQDAAMKMEDFSEERLAERWLELFDSLDKPVAARPPLLKRLWRRVPADTRNKVASLVGV